MKSILIIETPKDCGECPLCSKDENCWGDIVSAECKMQYKGYLTLNEMEKPNWCPLRPMPTDMIVAYANSFAEDYISFTEGWDSYAKALMGETE